MEARSQSVAHPNENEFHFQLECLLMEEPAICFLRICHRHFGCAALSSGLAVADLMSR